jgi:hypothetical protein
VQLKIDPKGAFPVTRRKDGISRQAPLMKREWKRQISSNIDESLEQGNQQLGGKECSNMVKQHFDDPVTQGF